MQIETKHGTLTYDVTKGKEGYRGRVQHFFHKHPKLNGKVFTRFSKWYKTERGAANWLKRQYEAQV